MHLIFIKKYFVFILIASSFLMADFNYTLSIQEDAPHIAFDNIHTQTFTPLTRDYINKGLSKKKYWLKITIVSDTKESLVINIQDPTINKLKFYDTKQLLYDTGDTLPFLSRERKDPTFAFKVDVPRNIENNYYIHFHDVIMMTFPITIQPLNVFNKEQSKMKAFYFIFLGFMLAIILYNLFLYFILRDQAYLYYILLELSLTLFLTALSGIGSYILWQDYILFNNIIYAYFDDLGLIFLLLFILTFLKTKKHFYHLYKVAIFLIVMIFILLFTTGILHGLLVKPVMISTIFFAYYIVYHSFRKKIPYSKYIIIGITFLSLSALGMLFRNFGWLEVNFFTSYSLYISTMIESILFSIALAKRIEYLKKKQIRAIEKSILLTESVEQKELLLREVRHRMKNNLQVISSFIDIAQMQSIDKNIAFDALRDRISAITSLHEAFEIEKNQEDTISINQYLTKLINDIQLAYDKKNTIELIYSIETFHLPFEKAMLLGLIVNETLTNSFKYAFPHVKTPKIHISLTQTDTQYIFEISDNGMGFNTNNISTGLGITLIERIIIKQLKGTYNIHSSQNGTMYNIKF